MNKTILAASFLAILVVAMSGIPANAAKKTPEEHLIADVVGSGHGRMLCALGYLASVADWFSSEEIAELERKYAIQSPEKIFDDLERRGGKHAALADQLRELDDRQVRDATVAGFKYVCLPGFEMGRNGEMLFWAIRNSPGYGVLNAQNRPFDPQNVASPDAQLFLRFISRFDERGELKNLIGQFGLNTVLSLSFKTEDGKTLFEDTLGIERANLNPTTAFAALFPKAIREYLAAMPAPRGSGTNDGEPGNSPQAGSHPQSKNSRPDNAGPPPELVPLAKALEAFQREQTPPHLKEMEAAWRALPGPQKSRTQKNVMWASCAMFLQHGNTGALEKRRAFVDTRSLMDAVSEPCRSCRGKGHSEESCRKCHGGGSCTFSGCNGTGRVPRMMGGSSPCPNCHGSGQGKLQANLDRDMG